MLTYLINVTGDLLAVFIAIGVTFAFLDRFCSKRGRLISRIGLLIGFIISVLRAYITNTRRLVKGWRVGAYGYGVSIAIFVLLALALIFLIKRLVQDETNTKKTKVFAAIISVLSASLIASYLYVALPNVYVYPFKFDTGGNGFLSTDYLFRLGGYLLGILVSIIAAVCAYKICDLSAKKGTKKLLAVTFFTVNIVYTVYNFARLMLVLTPRKIVDSTLLFNFAAASNNHAHLYTYAMFAVLIIMSVIFWVRSYTVKEPYATKAEHRKQRALWRSGKRYSVIMLCCLVCAVLCATWFVKLSTEVVREAPVEEPVIVKDGVGKDSELRVDLSMVSDGHLHRFGYTTDDGKNVRFIVVLKQENTNNYGIGLDACEICGEAGYYENSDGQVVCKKCNVVMNKTTIGMKGGCNPIIIDYDINESYITVPVSEMVNNKSRFSN